MSTVRLNAVRAVAAQAGAASYMERIADEAERIADKADDVTHKVARHKVATRRAAR